MPNLQKKYEKELRASTEYIPLNRFWITVMFILVIVLAIAVSEYLTRGKIAPLFEGGWLTYLVSEIRRAIGEFVQLLRDSVGALKF